MRGAALVALLAGCAKRPPEELPFELPAGFTAMPGTEPTPPPVEGPVAGPHYIVNEAPPPPVPAEVPGQGPLPPYLSKVRKVVDERLSACTGGRPPPEPAMVGLRIAGDGAVLASRLVRTSTDAAWDACLARAVEGELPDPPLELLVDGALDTPTMVFR